MEGRVRGRERLETEIGKNSWKRRRIYCGSVKMFVWPAPISVALSVSIAATRQTPNLSPMKTILPLIIAAGRPGWYMIPCSLGGAGFSGAAGVLVAAILTATSVGAAVDPGATV